VKCWEKINDAEPKDWVDSLKRINNKI